MYIKKSFIIGGVLFTATPEKKCRYEIGHKVFNNGGALKQEKATLECNPADEKTAEWFKELNDLHLLRPLLYEKLTQSFKDYIGFVSAGANREKMFGFESQNNGIVFIWAYINPNTREVTHKGFILRGIKEENFCKYYRGGIDKTAWFFHKKNIKDKLKSIRKYSYRQTDLYEKLDLLSISEIEVLLENTEDEQTYEKILKYIDNL